MTDPKGDKPRKIVVCHPDEFDRVNKAVMALDYGDVLVRSSIYALAGKIIIIDGQQHDNE